MADRYWVGGAGQWNSTNTNNWSAASALRFTASRSGTTLTTTGSPPLTVGMTVWSQTNTNLGTITSGSGNTWTTSASGIVNSQSMTAATIGASVPSISYGTTGVADDVYFDANSGTGTTFAITAGSGAAAPPVPISALSFRGGSGGIIGTSDFTGVLNTGSAGLTITGNFAFSPSMTVSNSGVFTFTGLGSKTIACNGKIIGGNVIFNNSVGGGGTTDVGNWTFTDNFQNGSVATAVRSFTLTAGNVTANGTVTTGLFSVTPGSGTSPLFVQRSLTTTAMYVYGTGNVYSQSLSGEGNLTLSIPDLYVTSDSTAGQRSITALLNPGVGTLHLQGSATVPLPSNTFAVNAGFYTNVRLENTSTSPYRMTIQGPITIGNDLDFGTSSTPVEVSLSGMTLGGDLLLSPSGTYTNIDTSIFTFTGAKDSNIRSYGQNFGTIRIEKTLGASVILLNNGRINARKIELRSGNLELNSDLGCTYFDSFNSVSGNRVINIKNYTIEIYGDPAPSGGGGPGGGSVWYVISVPTDVLSVNSLPGARIYMNPPATSTIFAVFRNTFTGNAIDYGNIIMDINPNRLIYIEGSNNFKAITNSLPATTGTGILQFESNNTTTVEDFTVNGSYSNGTRYLVRLQTNLTGTNNRHLITRTSTSQMVPVNFLSIGNIQGLPQISDPGQLYLKAACNCINRGNNPDFFFVKCSKLPLLGVG
jgi:hypothetical protein